MPDVAREVAYVAGALEHLIDRLRQAEDNPRYRLALVLLIAARVLVNGNDKLLDQRFGNGNQGIVR